MDATQTTTIVVSVATLCVSGAIVWRALRRYRRLVEAGARPRPLRRFTNRRLTMAALLAVVAVLLFVGVCLLDDYFATSPGFFTWFWLVVLGLLAWLFVLAIFDIVAIRHSRLEQWQRRPSPPPESPKDSPRAPKGD